MNIFLSWSKSISNDAANHLKELIINIFDLKNSKIKFFISSDDIDPGARWFDKICDELEVSDLAIICLSEQNRNSKWLDFESGAIAFNKKNATICPFLIDYEELENGNPLKNFQIIKYNKTDIQKLVRLIKDKSESNLSDTQLVKLFNAAYITFQRKMNRTINCCKKKNPFDNIFQVYPLDIKNIEPNKVFLGTPMASLDPATYQENREGILQVIEAIQKHTKFGNIYSPIINKPTQKDFDGKEFSVEKDFSQLKSSEYYIFIYPTKALSSILIEIGYAIALMKKTIIFVKHKSDLPFMLERADYRNDNVKIYNFKDFNDLKQQICVDGNYIFDF